MDYSLVVVRANIESREPLGDYTGKVSKTILLSEVPELEPAFRPVKGVFKPIRVSPPLELGSMAAVYPTYSRDGALVPVKLSGEYAIEVGCERRVAEAVVSRLSKVVGIPTRIKFGGSMLLYKITGVEVKEVRVEMGDTFVITIASPALLSDPFKVNQQVKRFSVSPSIVLWIPMLLSKSVFTPSHSDIEEAVHFLESALTEHYASHTRATLTAYSGKRVAGLSGRVKYILVDRSKRREVEEILRTARVLGVGSSRASGFGTVYVTASRSG